MGIQQVAIVAGVVILVMAVIGWWLSRGRRVATEEQPKLTINVERLGDHAPPSQGAQLSVHNTPVWLAAVVVAPAGRDRAVPTEQAIPELVDFAIPGLREVVLQHRSRIFSWPPMLSGQGFIHMFAREAQLPGTGGKGSPWCTVAGSFNMHGARYVMGLICRAERSDNLGQFVVESGKGWLDIVRVS